MHGNINVKDVNLKHSCYVEFHVNFKLNVCYVLKDINRLLCVMDRQEICFGLDLTYFTLVDEFFFQIS